MYIPWTEISELTGFHICYYDDETAYLQFKCDPPMSDTEACHLRMVKSIKEKFNILVHVEDVDHHDEGSVSMSIVGTNTKGILSNSGLPVSVEA